MAAPASVVQDALKRAKTTDYQNNGGLNALAHILVSKLDAVPVAAVGRVELINAFNQEYGVFLDPANPISWTKVTDMLKSIKDPRSLEVMVGPLLRRLLPAPLHVPRADGVWLPVDAADVLTVAQKFEIKCEGQATELAIKNKLRVAVSADPTIAVANREAEINRRYALAIAAGGVFAAPVAPIATLELLNNGQQWEYKTATEAEAKAHNAAYGYKTVPFNYGEHSAQIRRQISSAVLNNKTDINPIFNKFASDYKAKQPQGFAALRADSDFSKKIEEGFLQIMNPLGINMPGPAGGFFNLIGGFISKIMGVLFGAMGKFQELAKIFSKGNKTSESPLSAEDFEGQSAEVAAAGAEFADLSNTLASMGGEKGKRIAAEVNKAWREDPNSPDIQDKLIDAMLSCGLREQADEWLRAKEQEILNKALENLEGWLGASPLLTLLNKYKDTLKLFEDPALQYADEGYKQENFNVRYRVFKEYQADIQKLNTLVPAERAAHGKIRALQNEKNAGQIHGMAGGVHAPALLNERLREVQDELLNLNNESIERQKGLQQAASAIVGPHQMNAQKLGRKLLKSYHNDLAKAKQNQKAQEKAAARALRKS